MSAIADAFDPLNGVTLSEAAPRFMSIQPHAQAESDPTEAIRWLNSFLRGEIAAAETYRMAIDKMTDTHADEEIALLRDVQEQHGRAAQSLRDRVHELQGRPSDSSGAWGVWAKFTMGTARLFGDLSALKSLKEGEEHGLKEYYDGLSSLDATSVELVENQLIPAQIKHIRLLDQIMADAEAA